MCTKRRYHRLVIRKRKDQQRLDSVARNVNKQTGNKKRELVKKKKKKKRDILY